MKIRQIRIENFRSIKHIDLFASGITALVGANNAGKTNVLSALNFLLGERWPSRNSLEPTDLYNRDDGRDVRIQVWFEPNPRNFDSMWAYFPTGGDAETKVRFTSGSVYNLNNSLRSECALVYLDANRAFERIFSVSQWSLFGRVIRHLGEDFSRNQPAAVKRQVEDHFNGAKGLLRTRLYQDFEKRMAEAFAEQVKLTSHRVELDFKPFDPLNFYRSLIPILHEDGQSKNLVEAGQGMRNLVMLAMCRAYASVFRGDALIAIEEPELYLHPHAQRSLASMYRDLAAQGNQVFLSTHSAAFVDIVRPERAAIIERCEDDEGELCTRVRQVRPEELLARRKSLHPTVPMTVESMRERYRNICSLEHSEGFFAKAIVLVEGETEAECLPIYSRHLKLDLDAHGISVVNARSKNNLDALYHLFDSFEVPTYVVFDNDRGGDPADLRGNRVLLRLFGEPEEDEPAACTTDRYAIVEGTFETAARADLEEIEPGLYDALDREAREHLGRRPGKPLVGRYMAEKLVARGLVPAFIVDVVAAVRRVAGLEESADEDDREDDVPPWDRDAPAPWDEDEIPF